MNANKLLKQMAVLNQELADDFNASMAEAENGYDEAVDKLGRLCDLQEDANQTLTEISERLEELVGVAV